MDQRTREWLEWRRGGIGSSDAPIIMGVSPWKTAYQLWEEKTGRVVKEQETNWAIDRGNRFEPIARRHYELLHFPDDFPPMQIEHASLPMFRASMDGANIKLKKGVEFKVPGKVDHALAKEGKLPEKYYWQVQHQLMTTGFDIVDYVSVEVIDEASEEIKIAVVPVKANLEDITKLQEAELKFWDNVIKDTPPELSEKDFKTIRSTAFGEKAKAYREKMELLKSLEAETDTLKKEMLALVDHPRAIGYGIKIMRYVRKGNIDYAKIPELKALNLEQYRKPMSEITKVEIVDI